MFRARISQSLDRVPYESLSRFVGVQFFREFANCINEQRRVSFNLINQQFGTHLVKAGSKMRLDSGKQEGINGEPGFVNPFNDVFKFFAHRTYKARESVAMSAGDNYWPLN